MSVVEAVGYMNSVSLKRHRVRMQRAYMRRSALLYRHANKYKQWETAVIALQTAIYYRETAELIAGGSL